MRLFQVSHCTHSIYFSNMPAASVCIEGYISVTKKYKSLKVPKWKTSRKSKDRQGNDQKKDRQGNDQKKDRQGNDQK